MKRADILKWSMIASSKPSKKSTPEKQKPIRMRDFPAIITLERHLLLFGIDSPETGKETIQVCRDLFGIEPSETNYELPEVYWTLPEYDEEKLRLHRLWVKYDSQFETGDYLTDDETVVVLAKFGLDFLDSRGQPLLCTKLFSRAAEFAAKGIKGKLPQQADLQLSKFENSLTQERDAFLMRKRGRAN
jgi:hypothetical protein